ncbi:hypothetical protein SNE35_11470 [Paucibacter sp. R3-3]|uniref:Lipoprotein n=1 Tax=Roseateles agri TaxID=3098619 RepID=A0ABU5DG70_9BURK|nr:hypothetical protein [Paucibacter sp. R3-3]MDY0745134.1 hypothetical protein [Paucibacter sp. R3-3]
MNHRVVDGNATSLLLRQGPVAGHMVLTSGTAPRILGAFVAGNSGAALWFVPSAQPIHWRELGAIEPLSTIDAQGRALHGMGLRVEVDAAELTVHQTLLGSVRTLREYQSDGLLCATAMTTPQLEGNAVRWARDRLDGEAGYVLEVQVIDGSKALDDQGRVVFRSQSDRLTLQLKMFTGEPPLTPITAAELLTEPALSRASQTMRSALDSLCFLSYQEALLAGSWRFHTYFGRDTLMAVRLLMPALRPEAVEAALATVLVRLNGEGEVAHEEDIGEYPLLTRIRRGEPASAEPMYDYKMVDDDFMLLPVLAAYLIESPEGRARAQAYLDRRDRQGIAYGELVMRNASAVMAKSQPFFKDPRWSNLVALKPGEVVGDWRDSSDGLGGGRYPYSVNAALVPAALRAVAALGRADLLAPYASRSALEQLASADLAATVWETEVPKLYEVRVSREIAAQAIARHADEMGASAVLVPEGETRFMALALDGAGQPVPVLHSDFAFATLFGRPDAARLDLELASMMRAFPAGLMTDAGMLVANAAFASEATRAAFGPDHYHGAVVWSWQQALLAAGLARQGVRTDLPATTLQAIALAERALWQVIEATRGAADGELWTWTYAAGRYSVRPFGISLATRDESNAAQLWSTVYLAVQPPVGQERS